MIDKLERLGQSLRTPETHDALKMENFTLILSIDNEGNFLSLSETAKMEARVEAIGTRTRGYKARTLLDKSDYTLGIDCEGMPTLQQHQLFLEKLQNLKHIEGLDPVFKFYGENKVEGLDRAVTAFQGLKNKTGNIAFLIGADIWAHAVKEVHGELCKRYDEGQNGKSSGLEEDCTACSICGQRHPIAEIHDTIKRVPGGQSSGAALVSYNADAFLSYGFQQNQNSSICVQCAKNYTNALSYLLSDGVSKTDEKTEKNYYDYTHRRNMGGSCMLFWVNNNPKMIPKELALIENPSQNTNGLDYANLTPAAVDESQVKKALNSPAGSSAKAANHLDSENFYALIISGESGRIAVRSWAESTLGDVRRSILKYFEDISIYGSEYIKETQKWSAPSHMLSPLYALGDAAEIKKEKLYETLWNCALFGKALPLTLLTGVISRIQTGDRKNKYAGKGDISSAQAALIKLILNRNIKKGEIPMKPKCDETNANSAYLSGRLFAVMANVQRVALRDVNAGIADRFFTSASSTPAAAFGRLMKLNRNHLGKLSKEKPGLAVTMEKLIQDICAGIETFPTLFSLEDQGRFALGYYHQKQELFTKKEKEEDSHE